MQRHGESYIQDFSGVNPSTGAAVTGAAFKGLHTLPDGPEPYSKVNTEPGHALCHNLLGINRCQLGVVEPATYIMQAG